MEEPNHRQRGTPPPSKAKSAKRKRRSSASSSSYCSRSGGNPILLPAAEAIRRRSSELWGPDKEVVIIGRSPAIRNVLERIEKFAPFREPILITGDSGAGKEFVAHACHLLSPRADKPFEAVNCPQFQEGNLTVSELFGHVKGSFTGAVRDHKGHFETAKGGSVFLDEVADLHMVAQMMLLRTLAQQEFKPLGSDRLVKSDVRVIAATNRPLRDLIQSAEFREDLFFRLRYFPIEIPPLREREGDWLELMEFFLCRLAQDYGVERRLSDDSITRLRQYSWPGNVREVKSVATIGYSMASGEVIEPYHFEEELKAHYSEEDRVPVYSRIYQRIVKNQESFWTAVYEPYMDREINRAQASSVVRRGLVQTHGSYRGLVKLFNLPESDYHKFMDFLRHHRLKPHDPHFRG